MRKWFGVPNGIHATICSVMCGVSRVRSRHVTGALLLLASPAAAESLAAEAVTCAEATPAPPIVVPPAATPPSRLALTVTTTSLLVAGQADLWTTVIGQHRHEIKESYWLFKDMSSFHMALLSTALDVVEAWFFHNVVGKRFPWLASAWLGERTGERIYGAGKGIQIMGSFR